MASAEFNTQLDGNIFNSFYGSCEYDFSQSDGQSCATALTAIGDTEDRILACPCLELDDHETDDCGFAVAANAETANSRKGSDLEHKRTKSEPMVQNIKLPGGILDKSLKVDAIVQQNNCIGCIGLGLAEDIFKTLPYGCPYQDRTRMANSQFAEPRDRSMPGTIDVRKSTAKGPDVICCFAQWELCLLYTSPSPRDRG